MNRKGQELMVGMMILIMAIIIFIATLPALSNVFNDARQCNNLNCGGFVDVDATSASGGNCTSTNRSYNPNLEEDTLACTILDLGIPYLILGVLVAIIAKLLHGKLVDKPEPEYGMYPGY